MRPDGFTLEFQATAHLDRGGKEVGADLAAPATPKPVNKVTGLQLTEEEMFGAGG